MEKETIKNRKNTEQLLLDAVQALVEENGFEGLGVNAVATKAGVSKMLIYRYFGSLDELIAAYIQQHDFWINFNQELPDKEHLGEFIKNMFKQQIMSMRENYTLRRLCRWELSASNAITKQLFEKREAKGIWLIDAVSRLTGHSQKEIAGIATLLSAAITYLTLLEENCPAYNGIKLQQDKGWEQLEESIDLLIDIWISKL